jgi:hypothetical protein
MMSTLPNFGKICNKKIGNTLISMLRDVPGLFINLPLVTIMDPKRAQLSFCFGNLSLSVNSVFHFSV